jgi:type III restriction enzyme
VRALEERAHLEISFPRVTGYRFDIATERLEVRFADDAKLTLSTADVPTIVENAPIVGEKSVHTLDDLRRHRDAEIAFLLAKLTLERYFPEKLWLFPQLVAITKRWLRECVVCKDDAFAQLLLLVELAGDAVDRIYRSIVASTPGTERLVPILRPFDATGPTKTSTSTRSRTRFSRIPTAATSRMSSPTPGAGNRKWRTPWKGWERS